MSRARAAGVKLSVSRPSSATYKKRAWQNLSGPPWKLTPYGGRAAARYPETCPRWTSVKEKAGHSSIRILDPSLEGYMRCARLSLKKSHFACEIAVRVSIGFRQSSPAILLRVIAPLSVVALPVSDAHIVRHHCLTVDEGEVEMAGRAMCADRSGVSLVMLLSRRELAGKGVLHCAVL